MVELIKSVNEYKGACEANIVSILYKSPDHIYECGLTLADFSVNVWRVYFQIATDIVTVEQKSVLDDITVGLYLEKHTKLKAAYDKYGGYNTIDNAKEYVQVANLDGYVSELRKWNAVISLAKLGFPIKDRLSDFCDMTAEDIYNEIETQLNHTFANVESEIKSHNACSGLHELIDALDSGESVGMPLSNCHILNKEIGGLNFNGNIYGLGANSGVGKSTTAINYILPSIIEFNERVVMFINEEDERKVKKELLIWVANNVFKEELHKYILRDGKFDESTMALLRKSANWLESKEQDMNITVIPLPQYSAKTVAKLIKKYASLGVKCFILDTLKESSDATTDDIHKSMMRDMVLLYDVVKPASKNVALFVTYQLGKASIKQRYLTNSEIGQAKSIVDVMSVNLMMRKPFEDEFEGGKKELKCYKLEGKNGASKIPFKLKRDKLYMLTFVPKNRFGQTDFYQIVSEYNLSTNVCKDVGICNVPQDW